MSFWSVNAAGHFLHWLSPVLRGYEPWGINVHYTANKNPLSSILQQFSFWSRCRINAAFRLIAECGSEELKALKMRIAEYS
jgi:hypothetical protein